MQAKNEEAEPLFGRAIVILEGAQESDDAEIAVILVHQAWAMEAQV